MGLHPSRNRDSGDLAPHLDLGCGGCSVAQSCLTLCDSMGTAARQASLSFTNSQSLIKLMSIESLMLSNHLILCHPLLLLPSNLSQHEESFPMTWCLPSGSQRIGASASVLSMIFRVISFRTDWFDLLGVQGTRVFSSTTVQKHQFLVLSFLHSPTLTSIHDCWKNHSLD